MMFLDKEMDLEKELKKAGFDFITLDKEGLPEPYVRAAKYIMDNVVNEDIYKENDLEIVLVEDYMPMMGMVWRLFIYDRKMAKEILDEMEEKENAINLKRVIGRSQKVSIYYDVADILGIMGKPYFEIYDGNDVERYFDDEYEALYKNVIDILRVRL